MWEPWPAKTSDISPAPAKLAHGARCISILTRRSDGFAGNGTSSLDGTVGPQCVRSCVPSRAADFLQGRYGSGRSDRAAAYRVFTYRSRLGIL